MQFGHNKTWITVFVYLFVVFHRTSYYFNNIKARYIASARFERLICGSAIMKWRRNIIFQGRNKCSRFDNSNSGKYMFNLTVNTDIYVLVNKKWLCKNKSDLHYTLLYLISSTINRIEGLLLSRTVRKRFSPGYGKKGSDKYEMSLSEWEYSAQLRIAHLSILLF